MFDLSDRPFVKAAKGDYLLQSAAYDGVVYGAPLDAPSVLGAFYNKPLFKRLGLTPPTNLAELEKVLEAIKADGQVPPIFSAGGTQWPLLLLPYAAMQDLVTGSDFATNLRANKAKWTDQQVIDAIQVERDFFDKGYYNEDVLSASFDQELDAIATGKAGMIINQAAAVVAAIVDKYGLDQVNENVGFFGISTKDNATGWFGLSPGVGAGAAYVPKTGNAEKEEAAKAYVDWITGSNYANYIAQSGTLPYYQGVEPSAKVPQVSAGRSDRSREAVGPVDRAGDARRFWPAAAVSPGADRRHQDRAGGRRGDAGRVRAERQAHRPPRILGPATRGFHRAPTARGGRPPSRESRKR